MISVLRLQIHPWQSESQNKPGAGISVPDCLMTGEFMILEHGVCQVLIVTKSIVRQHVNLHREPPLAPMCTNPSRLMILNENIRLNT
jgi:hypothetical protein